MSDNTPSHGILISATSIALTDLTAAWAELRQAVALADATSNEAAREQRLDEVERQLAILGDMAHRVRVNIRMSRGRGVPP